MIFIRRLPEPKALADHKTQWTERYLKDRDTTPNKKPESKQYRHNQIKNALQAMSHGKCFYCECKLEENEGEVDHYIETSECPEKAFEWENLYWSCKDCNKQKQPNTSISVKDCLDPCDENINPPNHLTFNSYTIRPLDQSSKGDTTIRKYSLNRQALKLMRSEALHQFYNKYVEILKNMTHEGRATMNAHEHEKLRSFADASSPFSLMFRALLRSGDIEIP